MEEDGGVEPNGDVGALLSLENLGVALILGAVAVVGALRGAFGWRIGESGPGSGRPPASVEVAGALIDTSTVKLLTDQIGLSTVANTDLKLEVIALRKAVERDIGVKEEALRVTEQARRDVQDLRVALAVLAGKRGD